ncbi:hypothetical protein [Halopiger thermotolerans]
MSLRQSLERDGTDPSGDETPTALTAGRIAAVVLSIAGSLVAAGSLPETVRIHWTLGAGPYYGPEYAPTALVVFGFPTLVVALAVGAQRLGVRLRKTGALERFAPYYTLLALTALLLVLVVQAIVLGANV